MAAARELDRVADETLKRLREVSGMRSLAYNRASVVWLDSFVDRQRKDPANTPEVIDGLIEKLGCYFGRCIISAYGGKWVELEGTWAVQFDGSNAVFPFNKIAKQFESGASDSIRSMYDLIPTLYPAVVHQPEKRPWWKPWQ